MISKPVFSYLDVKILGPGCPRCYTLERNAREALSVIQQEEPGLQMSLTRLEDPMAFLDYQIFRSPGLVVNGKVMCSGSVPKPVKIMEYYRAALAEEQE